MHITALVKGDEGSKMGIEEEMIYDDIDEGKQEEQGQQLYAYYMCMCCPNMYISLHYSFLASLFSFQPT